MSAYLLHEQVEEVLLLQCVTGVEDCLNEGFNGKLRDELPNRQIIFSLRGSQVLVERWREE